jgi:hypothetical protein
LLQRSYQRNWAVAPDSRVRLTMRRRNKQTGRAE